MGNAAWWPLASRGWRFVAGAGALGVVTLLIGPVLLDSNFVRDSLADATGCRSPFESCTVATEDWPALVGTFFLLVAGATLVVQPALSLLRRMTGIPQPDGQDAWSSVFVGAVEGPLYLSAFLFGHHAFVAVWLGLKVAGGWSQWQGGREGRARFNVFLVGSTLSLLAAVLALGLFRSLAMDT